MPAPARRAEARRLPLRLQPVEGESFPSYVERLAADLGITLVEALATTGVTERAHHLDIPFCAGYTLSAERIAAFATNARLAPDCVAAMFLDRYAGVLRWRRIPSRAGTGTLAEARRLGVIVRSSNLCPDCIREDGGAWQASWMLVWHFACLRHRRLLADVCPSCTSFLGYGATHAIGFLSFPSLPPVPGRCGNSVRGKSISGGRGSTPCGQPLDSIDTIELEPGSPLLEGQRVLNDVLDGRPRRIDGEDVTAGEYLQELRSVATLLLWTGRTVHYAGMPTEIGAALQHDFSGVVNNRRWLRDLGTRSDRVFRAAGVLTAAVSFLGAREPTTLAERIEPLLRSAERAGHGRRYPSELRARLPPSRLVDAALQVAEAGTFRSPWRTTTARHASIRCRRQPIRVEEVPQLFWPDLYESLFKGLVTEIRDDPFRRFCSLTLAKIAGNITWAAARVALDLDVPATRSQIGWVRGVLKQLGNTDTFLSRVVAVADALGEADHRVDYAERRRQLGDLRSWPDDDTAVLCIDAGLQPIVHPRRRRNVGTWIWCELTGGDYRRAPAFRDGFTNHDQNSYMKFRRDVVPQLLVPLRQRSAAILGDRRLPSPRETWREHVPGPPEQTVGLAR